MASNPSPQTWTLRFKNNRSTIFLHVDPLQTLSSVKSELLRALKQTQPSGELNGLVIPQNSSDILLARPSDINDLSLGWDSIEPRKGEVLDAEESGKGKAKAPATPSTAASNGKMGKSALQDCAQSAGLRDGGVVAFKFRTEEEKVHRTDEVPEEHEDEDENGTSFDWDVVVPTWDDSYDDVMDQDEG